MKPDQVRERMEQYGLGIGEGERDLFLKEVCNAYEDLFYSFVEKEDKVNALNDAVRYYKNMEDNMAQMLSTISEISEKTEKAAEKTAQLTVKEAEGKADGILADASQKAAQIIEDAKAEAKEIIDGAEDRIADAKKERDAVKEEIQAYSRKFFDFLEKQKKFFEEHKIDIESQPVPVPMPQQPMPVPTVFVPQAQALPVPEVSVPVPSVPVPAPVPVQIKQAAVSEEPPAIVPERKFEDATVNQIRKIPNVSAHHTPTIEEIEANIPENIKNIPISDHTETLDEIIQSIKKSYEEVENR